MRKSGSAGCQPHRAFQQTRRLRLPGGWLACAAAVGLASAAQAQAPSEPQSPPSMTAPQPPHPPHPPHPPGPPPLGPDGLGAKLFPPEFIMKHQQELGIEDRQREAILKEIERAHAQIFPAQWQMSAAAEQLAKLVDAPKIDEGQALAQADKVMSLERDIKKAHLALLVRIRNLLTDPQRAKATEIRAKHED